VGEGGLCRCRGEGINRGAAGAGRRRAGCSGKRNAGGSHLCKQRGAPRLPWQPPPGRPAASARTWQ
jgi:hypothetical protein